VTKALKVFIGWDSSQVDAYEVCRHSILRHASGPVDVQPLRQEELRERGLYRRPVERRNDQLWDPISEAPMSTEFAITRFLATHLAGPDWAVFCDCDFLWRADITKLFELAERRYALMCVHHLHKPDETAKMDGKLQTRYQRKNWSSLMLVNGSHPANCDLTLDMVNTLPGRDLHRFCWLEDDQIGELPAEWNWLEGITSSEIEPKAVHFTRGGPWFENFKNVQYADDWRGELAAVKKANSEAGAAI